MHVINAMWLIPSKARKEHIQPGVTEKRPYVRCPDDVLAFSSDESAMYVSPVYALS